MPTGCGSLLSREAKRTLPGARVAPSRTTGQAALTSGVVVPQRHEHRSDSCRLVGPVSPPPFLCSIRSRLRSRHSHAQWPRSLALRLRLPALWRSPARIRRAGCSRVRPRAPPRARARPGTGVSPDRASGGSVPTTRFIAKTLRSIDRPASTAARASGHSMWFRPSFA